LGEIVEVARDIGMVRTEALFIDGERGRINVSASA
jgi:hypothetical protein